MRYFAIIRHADDEAPWVAAETVDKELADQSMLLWHEHVVLSEDEVALDPDFASAVRSWLARDDAVFLRREAAFENESERADEEERIFQDLVGQIPESEVEEVQDVELGLSCGLADLAERRGQPDVAAYYRVSEALIRETRNLDEEAAQTVERFIVLELAQSLRRRGVRLL